MVLLVVSPLKFYLTLTQESVKTIEPESGAELYYYHCINNVGTKISTTENEERGRWRVRIPFPPHLLWSGSYPWGHWGLDGISLPSLGEIIKLFWATHFPGPLVRSDSIWEQSRKLWIAKGSLSWLLVMLQNGHYRIYFLNKCPWNYCVQFVSLTNSHWMKCPTLHFIWLNVLFPLCMSCHVMDLK